MYINNKDWKNVEVLILLALKANTIITSLRAFIIRRYIKLCQQNCFAKEPSPGQDSVLPWQSVSGTEDGRDRPCWRCSPARCRGVEFRPWVSLQLIFSGVQSFCTLARQPFLAASNRAASPLSKSWMSVSPSLTKSKGVFPSLFFLVGSAPCCKEKSNGVCISYSVFVQVHLFIFNFTYPRKVFILHAF